jgi:hypothetical protein
MIRKRLRNPDKKNNDDGLDLRPSSQFWIRSGTRKDFVSTQAFKQIPMDEHHHFIIINISNDKYSLHEIESKRLTSLQDATSLLVLVIPPPWSSRQTTTQGTLFSLIFGVRLPNGKGAIVVGLRRILCAPAAFAF